jgi:hypothetical protein
MVVMPTPPWLAASGHAHEALGVGAADVGALVGEEHDAGLAAEGPGVGAGEVEADAQAVLHGGGALADDGVDGRLHGAELAAGVGREVDVGAVAVEHDRDGVVGAELAGDLVERLAHEVQRVAGHGARLVDDGDEVQRRALVGRGVEARGEAELGEVADLRLGWQAGVRGGAGHAQQVLAGALRLG